MYKYKYTHLYKHIIISTMKIHEKGYYVNTCSDIWNKAHHNVKHDYF